MRGPPEPKVHSFAPARPLGTAGRFAWACALFGIVVSTPVSGEAGPTSPAAIQQRIESLERHTAGVKGEVAALFAAGNRLDARPSLQACKALGDAASLVQAHMETLAVEYTQLSEAATAFPPRAGHAAAAAADLRRQRDGLLANALAVTQACGHLPAAVVRTLPPPARPLPVARGEADFVASLGVVFLWGPDDGYAKPGGGLRAGRLLAGAVRTLPEVVLVRLAGPVGSGEAFAASDLGARRPLGRPPRETANGSARGGATRTERGTFIDTPGPPPAVVVLPAAGPLVQTLALYGIARSFADQTVEHSGCRFHGSSPWMHSDVGGFLAPQTRSPPLNFSQFEKLALGLPEPGGPLRVRFFDPELAANPGRPAGPVRCEAALPDRSSGGRPDGTGPSAVLLVVSALRLPDEERLRLIEDWQSFLTPGPDEDPARSNFFEATEGRAALRTFELAARAGGCTSGVPDLP